LIEKPTFGNFLEEALYSFSEEFGGTI